MFASSIKSKLIALFAFGTVLTPFIGANSTIAATPSKAQTSQSLSRLNKTDALMSNKVILAQNTDSRRIRPTYPGIPPRPIPIPPRPISGNGKAMTWTIKGSPLTLGSKTYVLFGADYGKPGSTNPYTGDTSINAYRSLLCIRKTGAPAPAGLPPSQITPGGATKNSWSGGTVFTIPNVQGRKLTSQAVADRMCNRVGLRTYGKRGFRMAEFHDGNGRNAGWSFWAEVEGNLNPPRYWGQY